MGSLFPGNWHMIDEIDLVAMVADHAGLSRLCDDLEALADALPTLPGMEAAGRLRDDLLHFLPAHDARERHLCRRLFDQTADGGVASAIVHQIETGRAACIVQGQDLATALDPGAMPTTANTLGYMLRCFFQSCRQAMAFEELAILDLAGDRLTAPARVLLVASLTRRCAA
ncbi:hypothetical protein [Sphingomonas oryzagri]|uniref:Hemerythrin-like domain-containing protein n=1 Tax=Sphingomonas oryzagri TaxID=3042314 RepID=A0ABT6N5Q3_9SPHN|nr:hypothetical protein [Sphingomonas oryzagri]MDH7640433.1 hypothetical protein [Sphingomonas oryzagri]